MRSTNESPEEALKLRVAIDEDDRIAALARYQILDSLPEPQFDRLVRTIHAVCEVEWAAVTFVDRTRQWFKARHGFNLIQTPRCVSFCSVSMHCSQPLIIHDAQRDDRFNRNPLVTTSPKLRFYAGFPLFSSDGYGLGSLCVIDMKPRTLTLLQLKILGHARDWVQAALEVRLLLLAAPPNASPPADLQRRIVFAKLKADESWKLVHRS